jgi:hypothetical protein
MLNALLVIVRALRKSWLLELVGAALIVAGVHEAWGVAAALAAAGIALVLKAAEVEAKGDQ